MKTFKTAIALLISTIVFVLPSLAQDNAKQNPAFEKMKNILGKWEPWSGPVKKYTSKRSID